MREQNQIQTMLSAWHSENLGEMCKKDYHADSTYPRNRTTIIAVSSVIQFLSYDRHHTSLYSRCQINTNSCV